MARNEEKAQSMLNRFLAAKQADDRPEKQKRPYLASECHVLGEADKWRHQILREIARKVMEIQNAGLGEHRLRDLNDEINKLMREKGHWERRIVELGGPDYAKVAPAVTDSQGRVVAEASSRGAGYRYFGAAKNLPGVKELFETAVPRAQRRTRAQLARLVDADYYGLRDEEDGVLLAAEAAAELELRRETAARWAEEAARAGGETEPAPVEEEAEMARFRAYVALPEQEEIEHKVLEAKKRRLLDKYLSPQMAEEQEAAKKLLTGA